ncbi:MAG: OmpH family outer membrane protein [Muribaculaceae bacterium]|nr:OmpH family outer membrane protein [Muribaculaceae bacterium]
MFKKVLVAALVALPMCLQAQTLKFGVLNPAEIVQVMPEYATAQNTLKAASDKYEAQAKTLQDEYNKKLTELENLEKNKADQATMDAKINEIQDLQQRMQTFQQTASKDMQQQQETLMAPIQQKLIGAIQAVGGAGGYAGILDGSVLLYKGTQLEDVAAKVKAQLGIK